MTGSLQRAQRLTFFLTVLFVMVFAGDAFARARMYQPEKERFLQRDILKYVDGMNTYEYVGSNPLRYFDPSGRERLKNKKASTGWIDRGSCLRELRREMRVLQMRQNGKPRSGVGECSTPDCEKLTFVIKLPHPCDNGWGRGASETGHVGIGVGNDYYDYGPGSGGGPTAPLEPWWDDPSVWGPGPGEDWESPYDFSGTGDINLDHVLDNLDYLSSGFGAGPQRTVVKIEICICEDEADEARQYYEGLYQQIEDGTAPLYSGVGLNCTTAACNALGQNFAGGPFGITPSEFLLQTIENQKHTCGSNEGENVGFEIVNTAESPYGGIP